MFAKLTSRMKAEIHRIVRDKVVVDLGAGDFYFSELVAERGAKKVYAVEPDYLGHTSLLGGMKPELIDQAYHDLLQGHPKVQVVPLYFEEVKNEVPESFDIAILSWPMNSANKGLVDLLKKAKKVIYVGHNYDFTSCGDDHLFEYFMQREVEFIIEDSKNTLLIYGKELQAPRKPCCLEERGGLDHQTVLHWEGK